MRKKERQRAPGAGRKPLSASERTVNLTVRMPESAAIFAKNQPGGAGEFIRSLVISKAYDAQIKNRQS